MVEQQRSRLFGRSLSAYSAVGALFLSSGIAAHAQNSAVTVNVDVNANRRSISPLVYGTNYAGANAGDLNCPINRMGGNNMTRYNWQQNADNRGSDWFFQSIGDSSSVAGERADTFHSTNRLHGTQTMMTIPIIGWVGKVKADRSKLWSFSISKYGPQQANDWQWNPDSGNGVKTDGTFITGNDPNDASVATNTTFMRGWVDHLVGKFGNAASGTGIRYYILDNEHSLWHGTHRDVFPTGVRMDDAWARMRDYAVMIKTADPTSLVVGPEEWGWSGYFYSGYDQQYGSRNGWSNLPDRAAHGGMEYVPWLLQQFKNYETANAKRLLDVFTLHFYPQGGEFSEDTSSAMQLRRNRSTRALWDPNYIDETWIGTPVRLVPRMKDWVNTYYPNTKIGLTEYNWGAEGHINGATTQADILGILGREGMDIATRWTTPDPSTPTYKALKLYRNYDGQKGAFGDTSVRATVPNPDNLSAFASQDTPTGAVKVVVISKVLSGTTPVAVSLANFTPGTAAQVYQLTSANAITRLSDLSVSGTTVNITVPAQSITMLVIPRNSAPPGGTGTGLKGSYFNNMALTGTAARIRTDATVNFGWGTASPMTGINADVFSVRWEGQVQAATAGAYTFYTRSDDGVRLWVNGVQIVNNWTNHAATDNTGTSTISLSAGQKVSIKMEYYENTGGAEARLYWSYPGQTKQIIPQSRLYPAP